MGCEELKMKESIVHRGRRKFNFINLFAGAGGLGEGFIAAGYEPVAMVEKDKYCCQTLQTRLVYHELVKRRKNFGYQDYLQKKITKKHLYSLVDRNLLDKVIQQNIVRDNLENIKNVLKLKLDNKPLDLMLGGPPCQAYSIIGRRRNTDTRAQLYKFYLSLLGDLNPKISIFENVLGLLSIDKGNLFKEIQKGFKTAGYSVKYKIVDSSDYGVLQET